MPRRFVPALVVAAALVASAGLLAILLRASEFSDLDVYRWTARTVFDEFQLYDARDPIRGMQFLYPPFAALLATAASSVGLLTNAGFSALTILALARCAWLVAGAAPGVLAGHPRWVAALALGTAAAVTEPAIETLRLGQVGILLLWLVLEDALPAERRARGVLTGIATAIKLTPAIYAALFAVTAQLRALALTVATFAATVALGWALLPEESHRFWVDGVGIDSDRTDGLEFVGNQSVNGVLLRVVGTDAPSWGWLAGATIVGLASLWLARSWWQQGTSDGRLVALGVIGAASVLCSPIAWTHHWVAVLPLLAGLWSVSSARWVRGAVVVAWLVLCSRIVWRVPHEFGVPVEYGLGEQLIASSYVLLGAALLVVSVAALRARSTRR